MDAVLLHSNLSVSRALVISGSSPAEWFELEMHGRWFPVTSHRQAVPSTISWHVSIGDITHTSALVAGFFGFERLYTWKFEFLNSKCGIKADSIRRCFTLYDMWSVGSDLLKPAEDTQLRGSELFYNRLVGFQLQLSARARAGLRRCFCCASHRINSQFCWIWVADASAAGVPWPLAALSNMESGPDSKWPFTVAQKDAVVWDAMSRNLRNAVPCECSSYRQEHSYYMCFLTWALCCKPHICTGCVRNDPLIHSPLLTMRGVLWRGACWDSFGHCSTTQFITSLPPNQWWLMGFQYKYRCALL